MLGYADITIQAMTLQTQNSTETLNDDEWDELVALKKAINDNPASVHYEKMERFTELMVRSLEGKHDLVNGRPY